MTEAGCTGPECTFGGSYSESTAAAGECTQTRGYISNAEIIEMIESNDTSLAIDSWYDEDTDSNYVVYNETNWVAYMTDDVKTGRKARYQALNFAGTVDWAVTWPTLATTMAWPDGNCTTAKIISRPKIPGPYAMPTRWVA